MRFLRRSLIGIFLLSLSVGLLAWAANTVWTAVEARMNEEPRSRQARERVFSVNVVTYTPETITPVLETFGEVRSRRTLEIRAPGAGEVIFVGENFEEGGRVDAGEVLFRLDPQDAQSAVDTARADLAEARAELAEAEGNIALAEDELAAAQDQVRLRESALTRQQDLANRGVGSPATVETAELAASAARQSVLSRRQALAQARSAVDLSRTAVDRRGIALAEAERRLAEMEVVAEFAGNVSGVTLVEGGLLGNNEAVAQLIDPTALEVSFRVSTPQYTRLLGQDGRLRNLPVVAAIDLLGVDLTATGTITRESAAVAEGQTGRLLFARLDSQAGFRPGDFLTVRIEEPRLDSVALLPSSAMDADSTVLVVGEGDRLEVAKVDLLRRQGDDVIVRAIGLEGRDIVTSRSPLLGAGIKVRAVTPPGAFAQVASAAPPQEPEFVVLDPERKARLVAFVEANQNMPAEAKERVLAQLNSDRVPAQIIQRIESRMGG